LDVQEQIVLRGLTEGAVAEDDVDAAATEFLDEYGLMGKIPS
jgi:hypothetical protein